MSVALLQKKSVFGAMMMVTSCCIGAGMIGLPVVSASAGFIPSFFAICLAYAFSTGTGLLLLEATLWFDRQVNLMTIAQFAFGKIGKILVAALFLFLFYGIFVSYLDGGSRVFSSFLSIPREIGIFISILFVSAVLYAGIYRLDQLNRLLMLGLIITYSLIVGMGSSYVELNNLTHSNWKASIATLPILFISFGYQNLVPSLAHYLQKNAKSIRLAIVLGNFIPTVIYIVWNYIILGMINDPSQLSSESAIVTDILQKTSFSSTVLPLINAFCFFALFTSFITVAFSFLDFLKDGFSKEPNHFFLQSLVLLPPLFISFAFPNLFLKALSFAGGYIDMLLFGIFPVCMVWIGRYKKKINSSYQVFGGKSLLVLMFFLSITFMCLKFFRG
jgi:tyrosine-specific transport protein